MKKCIRLIIALLLLYFGYQSSFAQSFVRLFDATGQDHSNYDQRLQDSTDALLDIFINDSFADSFAIYDFGFYLHNEVFQGGFPGVFEQVTAQVEAQTEYFILIGRAYDDEGNFELFIKSKFPGHADFVCLQDVDRISLDGILRSAIEEELGSEIGVGPLNEAMAMGIHFLADRLNYLLYCSCSGSPNQRSINQCPTEHGFAEINVLLRGLGWRRTEISHVRPSTWDDSNEIYDFANKEFRIDGETVTIPDQIVESKATFDSLMSGKVYILDNESFNNGEWETFLAESINPANDYVEGWVIAYDGDQYYLYSVYFIGIDNLPAAAAQLRANFNGRSLAVTAMKYVLQVLGNAAIDACLQAVLFRILDEDISDWEKAFDEVSYLGAIWEGVSSLLPWSKAKRLGPYMKFATSALAVVVDKASRDDNYTIQEGFQDFVVGFGASVLTTLITHPKVSKILGRGVTQVRILFGKGMDRFYGSVSYPLLKTVIFQASKNFDDYFKSVVNSSKYISEGEFVQGVAKIDLMGGNFSQIGGDFVNIDIRQGIEKGIRGDATRLSDFIPSNSIDEIVTSNPYLGPGFTARDYVVEAAKVLKPGKKLYINGQKQNPFFNRVNAELAEELGLVIEVSKQPLLEQFKDLKFYTSNGIHQIDPSKMLTTVILKPQQL